MPQIDRISIEDAVRVGVALHKDGHIEEAQQVYGDILEVAPEQPDALHFLGVLKHQIGESEAGADLIEKALKLVPDNPGMRSNYGNVLRELGRFEEAIAAYRAVIDLVPDFADAYCNLGAMLRLLDRREEAESALKKAIELNPEHGEAFQNLGNLYRDLKNWDDSIQNYVRAVELNAHKKGQGKISQSLAMVLRRAGKHEQAERVVLEWFQREPKSPLARHMVAAFTGDNVPSRASDGYIREIFDPFASSFEEALNRLHYRAPKLVAAKVAEAFPEPGADQDILDAGCGTGFIGELLKPYAKSLVGVDLSPPMLGKARQKKVYDELVEGELTEYLSSREGQYDIVTSVDTLIYFGDLEAVLKGAFAALKPGGSLYFTLEKAESGVGERGYSIAYHGRYQHGEDYVARVVRECGFETIENEDVILRLEGGQPVAGLLTIARKADA